jgi:hypothetical protein
MVNETLPAWPVLQPGSSFFKPQCVVMVDAVSIPID